MSRFSRVVFLLLVGATFSAFFVAQELKSRPPVVKVTRVTPFFSPDGDGRRDTNRISVVVKDPDEVTIAVLDADGERVRRLASNVPARRFRPVRVRWDGRDDAGRRLPDGLYRVRVGLRRQGRSVVSSKGIRLDTTPPSPVVERVDPDVRILSPRGGPVALRVTKAGRGSPRLSVWRTDTEPARRVARLRADRDGSAEWDPTPTGGAADEGVYLVEATGVDRAGNVGSSAPDLPRLPREVAGSPGITIRSLAVQAPVAPAGSGRPVTFLVDSRQRPYRWSTRRLGRSRPGRRGVSRAGRARLTLRAPGGGSAVHLLELRSGRHRVRVPFLVQGEERADLLVVVPAISWLGRHRGDESGDGLPDTLEAGGPVRWPRPFAAAQGLPDGFADDVAPLLVALDRAGVTYDVTSDLALARGEGPLLDGHDGVLLPGSLRWVPRPLALRLRRYVRSGGRVAAIGAESMRRGVTVGPNTLAQPTQPVRRDPFGTRMRPLAPLRAAGESPPILEPLAEDPELGLLEGSDGVLTGFTRGEEGRVPERRNIRLLAALGRPSAAGDESAAAGGEAGGAQVDSAGQEAPLGGEPLPVLAATRVGRGLVIRVGLPEWSQRVMADEEVGQLNRNIVDLLRGVRPRLRSSRR